MADQSNFSGSIVIDSINLSKVRGAQGLNLTEGFINLELYEDILSPCLHGMMFLPDTQGKFSSSKIVGGEYLYIEYHSPEFPDDIMFGNFIVTSIKSKVPDGPSKFLMVLEFMSEIGYRSLHKKIPKLHKGNPVKLIRNILLNDLSVDYSPTMLVNESPAETDDDIQKLEGDFGEVSYMSSLDESPIEVIRSIASLMVDNSNAPNGQPVTGFYFFEGMKSGFELRSYSNLTGETYVDLTVEPDPETAAGGWDKVFYYDNNSGRDNGGKSLKQMMQQINKITINKQFDMIPRLMMGAIGKKVVEFDVLGKKYGSPYTFDYEKDFESMDTMNQYRINNSLAEVPNPTYRVSIHNTFNKAYDKAFVDMSINKTRTEQVHGMLATSSIEVEIAGRTTLDVGTRVWVFVSNQVGANPESGEPTVDKLLTGWYLVVTVKHMITPTSHSIVLKLVSDSYNLEI